MCCGCELWTFTATGFILTIYRPSRISLVTTAPDLVRLKVAEAMMTTIAADLVDIAPVATVIGLHLTVGVTMMMTVAATDLHRELVAQLMTIHHRAVVVSMILTVVTTLLQTHTRMAMVDHHMTDLLPETIHRVILDTVMTIVVPATGNFPIRGIMKMLASKQC